MATYTTRVNATKPASSENVNITTLNDNFDLFDTAVGATVGLSASLPASAFKGRIHYTTDSTKLLVNTSASASAAANWVDPIALGVVTGLNGNVSVGGALSVASGVTITSGVGSKALVRKSSSTGRASTTTVTSDPHLTTTIAASGVYKLEAHLYVSGSAGGDVKFGWSGAPAATERNARGPGLTTTDTNSTSLRSR